MDMKDIEELDLSRFEIETMYDPKWKEAGRVHDWRNYVGDALRRNWDTFSIETKLVVLSMAKEMANSEEWD